MESTTRVGRNEPCPCGSGKKYKNCCERAVELAGPSRRAPLRFIGVTIVGLALTGIVVARILDKEEPAASTTAPEVVTPPPIAPISTGPRIAQPPGPVPPGKVWSSEHGHWHDAAAVGSPNAPLSIVTDPGVNPTSGPVPIPTPAFTPQPEGPVPAGKVWSTEHGHWHDAPAAGTTPTEPR